MGKLVGSLIELAEQINLTSIYNLLNLVKKSPAVQVFSSIGQVDMDGHQLILNSVR